MRMSLCGDRKTARASTTVLQTAFQIVARALSPAALAVMPTLPTWVEMSLDPAGKVPNAT
jgi:hypothetical protein